MNQRFVRFCTPLVSLGIGIPCLLFFGDIICLALFSRVYFQTVAAFTLSTILKKRFSPLIFLCALFLILFSTLTTQHSTTQLAFLAGFFCLAKSVSYYCTDRYTIGSITALLITLAPLIHTPALSHFQLICTIAGCAGNLIVVYFSLKWSPAVKKGNRL